jgi:hypothetical protein
MTEYIMHNVAQYPTKTLSGAQRIIRNKIRAQILTTMANETIEVNPAERDRPILIEELSGKVGITSITFNVLILTKKQNYVIGKEELENIIVYIWDKRLHSMKNMRRLEGFYLSSKFPESFSAHGKRLSVSLLSLMH